MLVLQEKSALIFFGKTKINDLIMVGENNTSIEWVGFVLDDTVESLDAIVNVPLFILGIRIAGLVLEITSVLVLEKEPGIPSLDQILILVRSA